MKSIILFIILIFFPTLVFSHSARIHVVDVGEGQAVLLQQGPHGVLIDTGHFGKANQLISFIEKAGIKHLDRLYLTHLHPDHASGIFTIMNKYKHAIIFESGIRYPFNPHEDSIRWVEEALDDNRWIVQKVTQGDIHTWNGFSFKTLWPQPDRNYSINEDSLVLQISYGTHNVLVMGDATHKVEKELEKQSRLPEKVDVLIVGHHGANDATSASFLNRVDPVYAVISVNQDNLRGYPDSTVVSRLKNRGVILHITSEDGSFAYPFD